MRRMHRLVQYNKPQPTTLICLLATVVEFLKKYFVDRQIIWNNVGHQNVFINGDKDLRQKGKANNIYLLITEAKWTTL